eukprot:scaffold85325_cov30-Tisochrysis_lutea.AAC.4
MYRREDALELAREAKALDAPQAIGQSGSVNDAPRSTREAPQPSPFVDANAGAEDGPHMRQEGRGARDAGAIRRVRTRGKALEIQHSMHCRRHIASLLERPSPVDWLQQAQSPSRRI